MKPRSVSEASEQVRKWVEVRNDAIRRERAAGKSLRAIAEEAGLSHSAVAKICA